MSGNNYRLRQWRNTPYPSIGYVFKTNVSQYLSKCVPREELDVIASGEVLIPMTRDRKCKVFEVSMIGRCHDSQPSISDQIMERFCNLPRIVTMLDDLHANYDGKRP
jgi:hypothetical protein